MLFEYTLQTPKENFINITSKVNDAVRQSRITDGRCIIYCPHTTAGITINENADPDVVKDMLFGLDKAFPDRREFCHAEGNSSAHLKSSCIGVNQTIIVKESRLLLGIWQEIYFCEFDGPRNRKFYVEVSGTL